MQDSRWVRLCESVPGDDVSDDVLCRSGPMLVFDTALAEGSEAGRGEGAPCIPQETPCTAAHWSSFYRENTRKPALCNELSPWLEAKLKSEY